jgi:two-component system nitrogen regulation sensor histidine kinase NtrY
MSEGRGFVSWAGRAGLGRKLALTLGIFAFLSGFATLAALRGVWPGAGAAHLDQLLLLLNFILLLPLIAILAWRLVQLWTERRRGLAGSRLHTRLVVLFSLVAVIPTVIVAIFSYLLFSFGVQAWFSERVRTAVTGSLAVAEAYLHEHQQTIRADVVGMANDLNRDANLLSLNPQRFNEVVRAQAALRSLTEAIVFDGQGHLLARTGFSFALELQPVPDWALASARAGDAAVMTNDNDDRVRALVRLERYGDVYLYVGRFIDPNVINHMRQTQSAVAQYEQLEGQRSDYQVAFSLVFFAVGLLLLTGAVWVGLTFATSMARPIASLVAAAERVRGGDLAARVPAGESDEEFSSLSRAFNRMTHQLQSQQSELIEANRQLDQRRRFTETVLSGVSAGVIGLDQQGRINLPNRSASLLLGTDLDQHIGKDLAEVVPEMAGLYDEAERRPDRLAQAQVQIVRAGRAHMLLVRVAAERLEGEAKGYVVTFDDITELQAAQRKAAWADVARRIAHEIKNPLTPIQLSAQRVRKAYLKGAPDFEKVLQECTGAIVQEVDALKNLVDEFAQFARLPAANLVPGSLHEIIEETLSLYDGLFSGVTVERRLAADVPALRMDPDQMKRVLINLVDNAIDATDKRGRVTISTEFDRSQGRVRLGVADDGPGISADTRDKLFVPHFSTKRRGSGLGLAIVSRIVQEHHGVIRVEENRPRGARFVIELPA